MKPHLLAALLLTLPVACAAEHAELVPEAPTPLNPTPPGGVASKTSKAASIDLDDWVSNADTPEACELMARQMLSTNRQAAADMLEKCITRGYRRGGFRRLDLLLSKPWVRELNEHPEGLRLICAVIAKRGGEVDSDLAMVQRQRLPIFTLREAMKEPALYQGRFLFVRGRLAGLSAGKIVTARLDERALNSEQQEKTGSVSSAGGSTKGTQWSDGESYRVARSTTSNVSYRFSRDTYENKSVSTGLSASSRLPYADPFLVPDRDFLFFARFDGVREQSDHKPVAQLTVLGYYEPAELLLE